MPKIDKDGRPVPPRRSVPDLEDGEQGLGGDYLDQFEALESRVRLRGALYVLIGSAMIAGIVGMVASGAMKTRGSAVALILLFVVFGLGGLLKGLLELVTGRRWSDVRQGVRVAYIAMALLGLPILVFVALRIYVALFGKF